MVTKSYVHFLIFKKTEFGRKSTILNVTKLLIANNSALVRFHFLRATLKGIIKVSDCYGINFLPNLNNFFRQIFLRNCLS